MNLRFSIVTPVFNGEMTIARTIESVLSQNISPYEYYIVDGKSNDHTVDIAQEYTSLFIEKGIHYEIISERDNGIYDAMNKGIKKCTGDFIGIINSDDWYEINAIEVMTGLYYIEHFDMAYADIRMHNGNGDFIKKASNPRIVSSRKWNHPTQFVCKEIYQKKLYRNECIFDDLDMLLWIHKHNYKISVVNKTLANFTIGGVSNNDKRISEVIKRIGYKKEIYKRNGYSGLYVIDAALTEIAKLLLCRP